MTKNPPSARAPIAQAVTAAIAGTADVTMLRPDEIAPSPTNPRKTFPEASLAELADSMARDGQVQAILVRNISVDAMLKFNKEHPGFEGERPLYEIVSGERRWRAAQLKGLQLRAEIRELTDLQVVRIQIIENLHREEVHPLEEAEGYEYLLKHSGENITTEQIADEVGKSKSYVLKRMKLAALCESARKQFLAGDFDASTALLIARRPTPALQEQAIAEIQDIGGGGDADYSPSYREIRSHLARRFHLKLATAPFDTTLQDLVAGCGSCAECPKRTGNQSALFEDVDDADTCTDPDCFDAKRKAGVQRTIEQARADGIEVVQGEEAKSIRPNYWGPLHGHQALGAVAYVDEDGTKVTYEQLLEKAGKKAPKPILFLDPHNQDTPPQKLVSERAVEGLLKKFAPKRPQENPPPGNEEPDEALEQQRREHAVRDATRTLVIAALLKKASAPRITADLLLIVCALAGDDFDDGLLQGVGVTLPPEDEQRDWDHETAFVAALCEKTGEELAALAVRLALGDMCSYHSGSIPEAALELAAKRHNINIAGIRKKAEARADRRDNEATEEE